MAAQEFYQVAVTIQVSRMVQGPQGQVRTIGGLRAEAVGEGATQAEAYKAAEKSGDIDAFIDGLKAVEVVSGDFIKQ